MKGEIGSPESCDHSFCLDCILEWSKANNTCPQDRMPFLLVFVRKKVDGAIVRRIPVEEVKVDDIPEEEEEDPTFCEVCGRCDREDQMLLCDGCDLGFHMECLTPPLTRVPIEEWFCPDCTTLNSSQCSGEKEIGATELIDLLEDGAPSTSLSPLRANRSTTAPPTRTQSGRLLPRTRASEIVRARITHFREQRAEDVERRRQRLIEHDEEVDDAPLSSRMKRPRSKSSNST